MPSDITPRQAALWFAKQGHPVLPLHSITDSGACTCGSADCKSPGKHPDAEFAPNGLKNASTEASTVSGWFDEKYWLSYGVVTDDLLVIDVDVKHQGIERWKEICSEPTRPLIHTWTVRTGSGGAHVMFKNTPGIRSGKLDKGIDIRGKDAYIVGPQCKHVSGGTYHWLPQSRPGSVELGEPPDWLVNMIRTQSYCGRPKSLQDWRQMVVTRVEDGVRHDTLNRLIGLLVSHGLDLIVVRDLMIAWNRQMCDPPLSDKDVTGAAMRIGERELQKHRWIK